MRNRQTLFLSLVLAVAITQALPVQARYPVDADGRNTVSAIHPAEIVSAYPPSGVYQSPDIIRDTVYRSYLTKTRATAPVPSALPAVAEKLRYTVQPKDTLYRIAANFHTTVNLLMLENGIDDPRSLQIGQTLKIPAVKVKAASYLADAGTVIKVLSATLTAYTAGVESTGKTPSHPEYGITYSGTKAAEGRTIAVDPHVIPLGSTVYIEGIGIRKAEDIGSAIKGSRIDVFMEDVSQARKFGVKKNRKVYILSVPKVQAM